MIKIIGSLTSPFTRIVRVVSEELRIPYEFEVTAPFGKLDESQVRLISSHNPLMKIPILIDGSTEVLDSRIIVHYLLRQNKQQSDFRADFPRSPLEDNVLTVIYGIMDAGVLRFMLRASHPEIDSDIGYMSRSYNRIGHGLGWLENEPVLGQSFGVTEAALICGLEWFRKRDVYRWSAFPRISKVYDMYCERQSLAKTRIPESV